MDGQGKHRVAQADANVGMQEVLVGVVQGAVGDYQGDDGANHQQHTAGGLAMDELFQRRQ